MLRLKLCAPLIATVSAAFVTGLVTPASAHQPQRPRAFASAAVRPVPAVAVRPPARPARPIIQNAYLGSVLPYYAYGYGYGYGRPVVIERTVIPQQQSGNSQLTINTIPVVVGIRRAPEAQPLIYRIGDERAPRVTDRSMRDRWLAEHNQMRRPRSGMGPAGPEAFGPRIIVVR